MKRILEIHAVLITGDTKREILEIFPEVAHRFRKRKEFDEYYFDGISVELTIENIDNLTKLGFSVRINWERITLH